MLENHSDLTLHCLVYPMRGSPCRGKEGQFCDFPSALADWAKLYTLSATLPLVVQMLGLGPLQPHLVKLSLRRSTRLSLARHPDSCKLRRQTWGEAS